MSAAITEYTGPRQKCCCNINLLMVFRSLPQDHSSRLDILESPKIFYHLLHVQGLCEIKHLKTTSENAILYNSSLYQTRQDFKLSNQVLFNSWDDKQSEQAWPNLFTGERTEKVFDFINKDLERTDIHLQPAYIEQHYIFGEKFCFLFSASKTNGLQMQNKLLLQGQFMGNTAVLLFQFYVNSAAMVDTINWPEFHCIIKWWH